MDRHPALAQLLAHTQLLDDSGDLSLLGLSGPELDMLIEGQLALMSRVRGQLAEFVDHAVALDRPAELGAPNTASWLRGRFGISARSAGQLVREAADLRAAPVAAHAARAGAIGVEAAAEIGHAVALLPPEVGPELRAEGERVLLGFAVGEDGPALDPAQLRYVGRHLHEVLDPDAADQLLADRLDREEAATYRRRFLSLVDDGMGGVRIRGLVTTEAGAILRAVLDPLAAPNPARRVHADTDTSADVPCEAAGADGSSPLRVSLKKTCVEGSAGDGWPAGGPAGEIGPGTAVDPSARLTGDPGEHPVPDAEWVADERTPQQRLADALVEAGERLLSQGGLPSTGGERPQLVVTVDYDRLAAGLGPGTLANGDELSAATVRRLACDAGVIPAVLGTQGQVLDLGRTARTASPAQRRALALRDGGCDFPGCDRPPAWTEAHHIQYWEQFGPTDLENLVALCGFHHRDIHSNGWEIIPPKDGIRPLFVPPAWIDPQRRPRRNHLHHVSEIPRTPRDPNAAGDPVGRPPDPYANHFRHRGASLDKRRTECDGWGRDGSGGSDP